MKFAVLSDVHANSTALEKVLQDAAQYGVEKIICAGDVVGYGPDPIGTIRMLREHGVVTVMGNHDAVVARLRDSGDMIGHARDTDMRHRLELSQDDLDWLGSLPYIYEDEAIAVAHANFVNPALMGYVNDRLDAQQSFFRRSERMLFIGHTHVEALFAFGMASNPRFPDCIDHEPQDFKEKEGWQYLVNVGSVGYPRVRPYSSYVLYDSLTGDVLFRRVAFDFSNYIAKLREKMIPIPDWLKVEVKMV